MNFMPNVSNLEHQFNSPMESKKKKEKIKHAIYQETHPLYKTNTDNNIKYPRNYYSLHPSKSKLHIHNPRHNCNKFNKL